MVYDGDAAAPTGNAGREREREREVTNCELSDRDTRELDLQNPTMFDTSSFDYYERSNARSGADSDCLDGEYTFFFSYLFTVFCLNSFICFELFVVLFLTLDIFH